ncbi:MAG: alpha/beta fold hydrolase [Anaerolineae bacterium]
MKNPRTYGPPPFEVAVIHGGPGAGGEMAPVARALASGRGVLEPIQTAATLEGQIEELRALLVAHGHPPLTLIGYSWGAWLSFILTARYPDLVKRLVLVSSGPFEEAYVPLLHETRMSRLTDAERREFEQVVAALSDPTATNKDALLARLGALASRTDTFAALPHDEEPASMGPRADVFQGVWATAAELRRSGALLALGRQIACPVVAIHGDYDPHPPEGVEKPLSRVLHDFRFHVLPKCGHRPWIERYARDQFYRTLKHYL